MARGVNKPDRGSEKSEARILSEVLVALGSDPRCRVWRSNTGVARTLDDDRVVRFGVRGAADITGILADGRRLEIEVKRASGKVSEDQARFGSMIRSFGGIFAVVRSAEEAVDVIDGAFGGGIGDV